MYLSIQRDKQVCKDEHSFNGESRSVNGHDITCSELERDVEGFVMHFAKHFSFVFWYCHSIDQPMRVSQDRSKFQHTFINS